MRVEFLFDPQTSGGLLISVPRERADDLVAYAKAAGASAACIVGSIVPQQEARIVIRP